jgi:Zn-dependent protease with chaperone function
MSDSSLKFTRLGFAKTFLLPALLVFLVPVLSLLFFRHAQNRFNADARDAVLAQIRGDQQMSSEEKEKATAIFDQHPFSELLLKEEFAAGVKSETRLHFGVFRWMIRLSIFSIASGLAVFLLAGVCVLLSLRSQQAQYISLSLGWHVLRVFGAMQAIIQGILLVALSFWVTALWMERYMPKLILITAIIAGMGVIAVIAAIFKRVKLEHGVEGTVIDKASAIPLWQELGAICDKVGTAQPDRVIVGIDDNFFVTESPITVNGKIYHNRTLFMSLALVKQLNGSEADAILAHEMAHFSGNDTVYSKKISPLLAKYGSYLEALYQNPATRLIFYFMHCFRAFYELSLGKLSRQREFRADRIAAEVTSPRDFAGALLRVAAYSKFRGDVQQRLFDEERVLEAANISEQIEQGFRDYSRSFATRNDIRELETAHPFDSHPPTVQRLEAVGVPLDTNQAEALLEIPGDGKWYHIIENAAEIERQHWADFEARFRSYHEESLPYRFLPSTDEERVIVVKSFPEIEFQGAEGTLTINHESMHLSAWTDALNFGEIRQFSIDDQKVLTIQFDRGGKQKRTLKVKKFNASQQQNVIDAINHYYSRHAHAVAYQEARKLKATTPNAT